MDLFLIFVVNSLPRFSALALHSFADAFADIYANINVSIFFVLNYDKYSLMLCT